MERVVSPDGREWQIRSRRLRPPPWRAQDWGDDADTLPGMAASLLESIAGTLVVPLLCAAVELPVALVRSAFTRTRRIEAACFWPAEIRIVWATSQEHAAAVCSEIAEQLRQGYDHLEPANATFVEMTPPPGIGDLDT